MSPERSAPAAYFCRGALIRLEDGSFRRVEEMRTEDFVMSADRSGELTLTQCTLLRLDERGDRLALTLTYDRNRSQVKIINPDGCTPTTKVTLTYTPTGTWVIRPLIVSAV